jgi:hypothetical protein
MFLYLIFDHTCFCFVASTQSKTSVFPNLASSQHAFNFKGLLKYFSYRFSFKPVGRIRYRLSQRATQKDIRIIPGYFHRIYLKSINDRNFFKTSLHIFPSALSKILQATSRSPNHNDIGYHAPDDRFFLLAGNDFKLFKCFFIKAGKYFQILKDTSKRF